MNAPFSTKTFINGNSVALPIPAALGIGAGVSMSIEKRGQNFLLRPENEPSNEKRKLVEFIEQMREIGPIGDTPQREPIDFPDRPGLY